MLSYAVLKQLKYQLIADAETIGEENDPKVKNLLKKIDQELVETKDSYDQYSKKFNEAKNYYFNKLDDPFYKGDHEFSVVNLTTMNDLQEALTKCQTFLDLFEELRLVAGDAYILDLGNPLMVNSGDRNEFCHWNDFQRADVFEFRSKIKKAIEIKKMQDQEKFNKTFNLITDELNQIEKEKSEEEEITESDRNWKFDPNNPDSIWDLD